MSIKLLAFVRQGKIFFITFFYYCMSFCCFGGFVFYYKFETIYYCLEYALCFKNKSKFFFFFIIIIIEPANDSRHSGSVWGFRLPIAVQHIWCEQTLFVSVTKVTRRNREGNLPRQQYKLTGVLIQSFPPSEIKKKSSFVYTYTLIRSTCMYKHRTSDYWFPCHVLEVENLLLYHIRSVNLQSHDWLGHCVVLRVRSHLGAWGCQLR